MILSDKIRLMKDLIKENTDITIGEYSQTVAEIESVEHNTEALYVQTTAGILEYSQYKKKQIL